MEERQGARYYFVTGLASAGLLASNIASNNYLTTAMIPGLSVAQSLSTVGTIALGSAFLRGGMNATSEKSGMAQFAITGLMAAAAYTTLTM